MTGNTLEFRVVEPRGRARGSRRDGRGPWARLCEALADLNAGIAGLLGLERPPPALLGELLRRPDADARARCKAAGRARLRNASARERSRRRIARLSSRARLVRIK